MQTNYRIQGKGNCFFSFLLLLLTRLCFCINKVCFTNLASVIWQWWFVFKLKPIFRYCPSCLKKDDCFKSGCNWLENNQLANNNLNSWNSLYLCLFFFHFCLSLSLSLFCHSLYLNVCARICIFHFCLSFCCCFVFSGVSESVFVCGSFLFLQGLRIVC